MLYTLHDTTSCTNVQRNNEVFRIRTTYLKQVVQNLVFLLFWIVHQQFGRGLKQIMHTINLHCYHAHILIHEGSQTCANTAEHQALENSRK